MVGVLGDELAQRSNGKSSSVSQDKRIELLANISSVDSVVPCDTEEMIKAVIQRYQVSVLVNGDHLPGLEERIEKVVL